MTSYQRIVLLTGAGLSAESGLGTFRDKDGLWTKFDLSEVATPEGFARNPELVREFYNARKRNGLGAKPNAAHFALAELEARHPAEISIVTQNIDPLHEAAGSKSVIHMHGEILRALCAKCGHSWPTWEDFSAATPCPSCAAVGGMRPDVVWFGEMPYRMDAIYDAVSRCDLFVSIGTSGTVYPAAGLVAGARAAGAYTVELNLEPSEGASQFHEAIHGLASEVVPAFVNRLLSHRR